MLDYHSAVHPAKFKFESILHVPNDVESLLKIASNSTGPFTILNVDAGLVVIKAAAISSSSVAVAPIDLITYFAVAEGAILLSIII